MMDFKFRKFGLIFLVVMNLYLASPYNPTSQPKEKEISGYV
jgi:hypothetical protein